jgi:hypothetical protein
MLQELCTCILRRRNSALNSVLLIATLTIPSTWHDTNFRKKLPLGPSEIWLGKKLEVYHLVFIVGETQADGI